MGEDEQFATLQENRISFRCNNEQKKIIDLAYKHWVFNHPSVQGGAKFSDFCREVFAEKCAQLIKEMPINLSSENILQD